MFVIRERLYAHPVFLKTNVVIKLRTMNKTQISRLVRTTLLALGAETCASFHVCFVRYIKKCTYWKIY